MIYKALNHKSFWQALYRKRAFILFVYLLLLPLASVAGENLAPLKQSEVIDKNQITIDERPLPLAKETLEEKEPTENSESTESPKEAIYQKAVVFANWVDQFFGENKEIESASYDYLRLINNFEFREGESPKYRPKVKAKVHLPQLSRNTSLLLSNDKTSDSKDFSLEENESVDSLNSDQGELSAAINYQAKNTFKSKLDFRLGLNSSLDIFAFARHTTPLLNYDTLDIENTNYLFWEEKKGFGVSTEFELNKVLNEESLFRWKYTILRAEKSRGNEWKNKFSLVNHLSDHKWISYDIHIAGATQLNYDVELYRFGVRFRNRTSIDWLYFEFEPEVRLVRNERYPERELVPGITIRLEIQFDKK